MNTARFGGGIATNSSVTASGNWWGYYDLSLDGPTVPIDVNGRQGAAGDALFGDINYANTLVTPPILSTPNLLGALEQGCFQLRPPFISTLDATWGRPDLTLEVWIRASDLLGREITIAEAAAFSAYVGSVQGMGFSDNDLNIFAEAIGRIYYEYNKPQRGSGTPACSLEYSIQQRNYITIQDTGLLCSFGGLSEWFGELDNAEYQSLFIVDFIRLGIINQVAGNSNITWLDRGNWIFNPSQRQNGRPDNPDCLLWELGLNRTGSSDYDSSKNVQGCPWVWGNASVLDSLANARIYNGQYTYQGVTTTVVNNTLLEGNFAPSYKPNLDTSMYIQMPDSNMNVRTIVFQSGSGGAGDFFLFTILQNAVIECNRPLVAIQSNAQAGYTPVCRQ